METVVSNAAKEVTFHESAPTLVAHLLVLVAVAALVVAAVAQILAAPAETAASIAAKMAICPEIAPTGEEENSFFVAI